MSSGSFNAKQTAQLLRPIAPARVLKDADGHSHVSQQDIAAHLIRVFGFGGFDTELLSLECIFEEPHVKNGEVLVGRFDVCYRAVMRLTVRDPDGNVVCRYEDGSTATAQNQKHGAAHDLAMKSAISLAKKRAAINLGDQFGLSLYNKGQMTALVRGTLVNHEEAPEDVEEGVEQQVSLGNDEIDTDPVDQEQWVAYDDAEPHRAKLDSAGTLSQLAAVASALKKATLRPEDRERLLALHAQRQAELRGDAA